MRDQGKFKKPYIYIKMLDTFTDENDTFLSLYNGIGDEVAIEQPFNWPGFDNIKAVYGTAENEKTGEIITDNYKQSLFSTKNVCEFPFFRLSILNNGNVSACCVDAIGDLIMGNINEQSLYQIWNGDVFTKLRLDFLNRKMNIYSPCKNCNYFRGDRARVDMDSLTTVEYMNRCSLRKLL
jgi:radical SAM protein with 4Fe4S-binding SPASM domain